LEQLWKALMNCISPPEPETRLLMAFLDGEADPGTVLHLQQCAHCRERAETLAREQELLTSRLFRISCPSATELGEYHLHMLLPDQMLVVSQHLRDCPHCMREIDELKEFLSDLAPSMEGNLVQRAKMLVARLISGNVVSSPFGETTFALRGEKQDMPLTFEVSGILVVIDTQLTVNGKLNLIGQIAADQQDDWAGASVRLNQEDQPERSAKVDDLGAFQFMDLIPCPTKLQIQARDGTTIVIPEF
jgi:hypothetical protein